MDPKSIDERVRPAETQQPSKQHLDLVASSFQELFTFLEEYAPVWYTEQHLTSVPSAPNAPSGKSKKPDRLSASLPPVVATNQIDAFVRFGGRTFRSDKTVSAFQAGRATG